MRAGLGQLTRLKEEETEYGGAPLLFFFFLPSGGGRVFRKDGFVGLRFLGFLWFRVFCSFSLFVKLPPLFCVLWRPVFIGKNIVWASKLVPQLSFFCKFDFSFFFGFSYQHHLE